MRKTLRYARRLVSFDSTSHLTNRPVSKYIARKLARHGFEVEWLEYRDGNGVRKANVVAKKGGGRGGLAYFGHTDVVPAERWFTRRFGPFEPTVMRQRLYGRGSCDMKGSIACMLEAAQGVPAERLQRPLYFVTTADEEVGFHGAKCVVSESRWYREMVDHGTRAIIGEPTEMQVVHAHKGSCGIRAVATGRAAHSSTSEGVNANLAMIPFLAEMKAIHDEIHSDPKWQNPLFDPPTLSWNIGINDHNAALNITAPRSVCTVYLRPMVGVDHRPLLERVEAAAERCGVQVVVDRWAEPFWVDPDSTFVRQLLRFLDQDAPRTVSYGTDAGTFTEIAEKVVLGPGSIAQAHTWDEWISLEQLARGTELYRKLIESWCCGEAVQSAGEGGEPTWPESGARQASPGAAGSDPGV